MEQFHHVGNVQNGGPISSAQEIFFQQLTDENVKASDLKLDDIEAEIISDKNSSIQMKFIEAFENINLDEIDLEQEEQVSELLSFTKKLGEAETIESITSFPITEPDDIEYDAMLREQPLDMNDRYFNVFDHENEEKRIISGREIQGRDIQKNNIVPINPKTGAMYLDRNYQQQYPNIRDYKIKYSDSIPDDLKRILDHKGLEVKTISSQRFIKFRVQVILFIIHRDDLSGQLKKAKSMSDKKKRHTETPTREKVHLKEPKIHAKKSETVLGDATEQTEKALKRQQMDDIENTTSDKVALEKKRRDVQKRMKADIASKKSKEVKESHEEVTREINKEIDDRNRGL